MPEKKVKLYRTEFDVFKTELERHNLHKRLTNLVDGSIDVALVKEFYANLYSSEGPSPKQARFRGHLVKIDADSLNTFLETPVVWHKVRLCLHTPDIAGCLQILGRLRLPYAYQVEGSS